MQAKIGLHKIRVYDPESKILIFNFSSTYHRPSCICDQNEI